MPEIKPVYVYGKWRFRNKTYPSAQWHMVICQAELDVLLKHPDKFEIQYSAKGFPMTQKKRPAPYEATGQSGRG